MRSGTRQAGRLYVRSKDVIRYNSVVANDGADKFIDHRYSGHLPAPRAGTKLGAIPLIKPPYAQLTAIDLNNGELLWQVPLGEGSPAIRNHALLKGVTLPDRLGSPSNGGAILTGGGLIFIGGGDGYLYALRQEQRQGAVARQAAVRERREHDDLPHTRRPPVRAGVDRAPGTDASLVAFALQ